MKASYRGNPDGVPIYPNEIDHGYEEPISGDTSVMRNLVTSLRHEQGLRMASRLVKRWISPLRRESSRIASSQKTEAVAKGLALTFKSNPVSEGSMGWRLETGAGVTATETRFEKELSRICIKNACLIEDKKINGTRREILIIGAERIGVSYSVSGGYVKLSTVEIYDN